MVRGAGCAAGEKSSRQEQGAPKAVSQLRVCLALLGLWFYFSSCSSQPNEPSSRGCSSHPVPRPPTALGSPLPPLRCPCPGRASSEAGHGAALSRAGRQSSAAACPAAPALSIPTGGCRAPAACDCRSPLTGSCFIPEPSGQLGCSLKRPPSWRAGSHRVLAVGWRARTAPGLLAVAPGEQLGPAAAPAGSRRCRGAPACVCVLCTPG